MSRSRPSIRRGVDVTLGYTFRWTPSPRPWHVARHHRGRRCRLFPAVQPKAPHRQPDGVQRVLRWGTVRGARRLLPRRIVHDRPGAGAHRRRERVRAAFPRRIAAALHTRLTASGRRRRHRLTGDGSTSRRADDGGVLQAARSRPRRTRRRPTPGALDRRWFREDALTVALLCLICARVLTARDA